MGFTDQVGGHPTLSLATRPQIWLILFRCEVASCLFRRSLCLHVEDSIHQNNGEVEFTTLLKARLQILLLLLPLSRMKTLLQRLAPVVEGVIFHDTHVVNTVSPSLPEVGDENSLLLLFFCI